MPPILMSQALSEWIVTGTFVRRPRLQVVLVEAGLGWIPYMLDRLDRVAKKSKWKDRGMNLAEPPSYYWHTNMSATFEEDELRIGVATPDRCGQPALGHRLPTSRQARGPSPRRSSSSNSPSAPPTSATRSVSDNAARLYRL